MSLKSALRAMPAAELEPGATNVELMQVDSPSGFEPAQEIGATGYRVMLDSRPLDVLMVNAGSDVLVVSFHGALQREKYALPRFERLRSLIRTEYSSMYFADPSLHIDRRLSLAWYTGWAELDLYPLMAEWIRKAASAIGASRIILAGSSGGGFASLQTASFLPDSLALPFSPQTAIVKYGLSAQRRYLRFVMPGRVSELDRLEEAGDWSLSLGVRASAVRRYSLPQANRVLYVQNMNDPTHVVPHYLPFRAAVEPWASEGQVRFWEYDGPSVHNPPQSAIFHAALNRAVEWQRDPIS